MTKKKANSNTPKRITLDPLSPRSQRPPGTRSGSQYNSEANNNANESNPKTPTELPNSNQSTQPDNARSIDAPEEQMPTRTHASDRSRRTNRSRAPSNASNASQRVSSFDSQKSNRDPDGISADELAPQPQPRGSRSLIGSTIMTTDSLKKATIKVNNSVVSDITPDYQNQEDLPSTSYVDPNGDPHNLPPGIVTGTLSPLDPILRQSISNYVDSAVKERLATINENKSSIDNRSISSNTGTSLVDNTYGKNASSSKHLDQPLQNIYIEEVDIGGSRYTNVPFIIQVGSTLYFRYGNDLVKPVKVRETIPPTESRKHPIYFVQYFNGHTETVTHDKLFVPMDRQFHRHENGVIDAICEVLSPQAQLDAAVMHDKDPHSIKMFNSENLDHFKIDKLKTMLKDVNVTDDKLSTLSNVITAISIATQAASTSGNFALPQVKDLSPTKIHQVHYHPSIRLPSS